MAARGGDDRVFAGAGADIVIGGPGADTIDGGSDIDTASYETAGARVSVSLDDGEGYLGDATGDILINIENIRGSAFDDYLRGDRERNFIWGGEGNDKIYGFGGIDELHGEGGDDELTTSYWHDDRLYGGDGNDTLNGSSGDDFLYGGAGDDRLIAGYQVNIYGDLTPGNDYMDGGDGNDTVEFWWSDEGVVVDLDAGWARFEALGETVTLVSIENVDGTRNDDTIVGSDGDNVLNGDQGNDLLVGGGGNDTLDGGSGNDRYFGGIGVDTAVIDATVAEVSYAYVDGAITVSYGSTTKTVFDDVETLQFSDETRSYGEIAAGLIDEFAVIDDFLRVDEAATVTLDLLANDLEYQGNPISILSVNGTTATPGAVIRLASGATATVAADGSLTFDQGGAYAWLDAKESALETITYEATDSSGVVKSATATILIDGTDTAADQIHLDGDVFITETNPEAADALLIGNFDVSKTILIVDEQHIDPNDLPTGYEVQEIDGDTFITYGGDDAVVLKDVALDTWAFAAAQQTLGTAGNDRIDGTDGADVINAGAGADTVYGMAGDDVVVGGDGNDYIHFTDGNNVVLGGNGNDTVSAEGDGTNLFYGGIGNDALTGGEGDDIIYGGTGNDQLLGGEGDGDDRLYGGDGDDVLYGGGGLLRGGGIDFFDGGEGFDRLDLQSEYPTSSSPGLIVDMRNGYFGWADNSYGIERFQNIEYIVGTNGNDIMRGNDLGIRLDGVSGNDTLIGGAGNDTLTDGYGSNEVFGEAGDDYIFVSASGVDLLVGGTGDDTLRGGVGGDVIVYRLGDGHDTVELSSSGSFHYDLTAFAPEDVVFSETSEGHLLVSFADGGTLTDADGGVTSVAFSQSVTLDAVGIAQKIAGDQSTNTAPVALDDVAIVEEDGTQLVDVTVNDTDEDGDTLTITGITDPTNGSASIEDNQIRYTPDLNFNGTDTLSYTLSDGNGGTSTATLAITVDPVNDSPVVAGDTVAVTEGQQIEFDPRANDTDVDGDGLTVTSVDGQAIATGENIVLGSGLTVGLTASGTLTLAADQDIAGLGEGETRDIPVSYAVADGKGGTASGTITVTVTGQSDGSGGGGATIDGTSANDVINDSYVDADGEAISDGGQTILGYEGDDAIYDGAGDDIVDGGAGRDLFYAGDGSDTFIGGDDRDEVIYTRATAGLTIDMTDAGNSTGIAAGDTYAQIEYLRGSNHDDTIMTSAERTYAKLGDDVLIDTAGFQRLDGGSGADIFRFVVDGTQDRVEDFTLGEDRIDVSLWGVTSFGQLTIVEAVNGQGQLQGRLTVSFDAESIRLDGLATADIAALDASHFLFA